MDSLISKSPVAESNKGDNSLYHDPNISIYEVQKLGLIRLQTFSRNSQSSETITALTELNLPQVKQFSSSDTINIYWSAPFEWIISVPAATELVEAEKITAKLAGTMNAVTLMTDSRIILKLNGLKSRQLLAKGSAIDFHSSQFNAGTCVTTKFAQIPIMIAQVSSHNDNDEFLLFADRPSAAYLLDWLIDAASEF